MVDVHCKQRALTQATTVVLEHPQQQVNRKNLSASHSSLLLMVPPSPAVKNRVISSKKAYWVGVLVVTACLQALVFSSSYSSVVQFGSLTGSTTQHQGARTRKQKAVPVNTTSGEKRLSLKDHETSFDESFALQNLNCSQVAVCGAHKCFFRLPLSPEVGYLVAQQQQHGPNDWHLKWQHDYWFMKHLKDTYGMRHLQLEAPHEFVVPVEQQSAWRDCLDQRWAEFSQEWSKTPYNMSQPLFIQKNRVAPKPSLIVGCWDKVGGFSQQLSDLLQHVADQGGNVTQRLQDFSNNFSRELSQAWLMLQLYPEVAWDYQSFVNEQGIFYHLDLGPQHASWKSFSWDIPQAPRMNRHREWLERCKGSFQETLQTVQNQTSTIIQRQFSRKE